MSRTIRRVLVALLALGLTGSLAACGDDDDDAAGSDSASASGSEPSEDGSDDDGGGDFCGDVQNLDTEMDAIDENVGQDPARSGQLFSEIAGRMDDIDAPEEIADDWDRLQEAMGQIADIFADIDFSDPESVAQLDDPALEAQFSDLEAVGDRVEEFVKDECGIDLSGDDEADEGETTETTAAG